MCTKATPCKAAITKGFLGRPNGRAVSLPEEHLGNCLLGEAEKEPAGTPQTEWTTDTKSQSPELG